MFFYNFKNLIFFIIRALNECFSSVNPFCEYAIFLCHKFLTTIYISLLTIYYNMFCENCGKKIPDDVKFCPFCGHVNKDGVKAVKNQSSDKNMILALVISFFFTGLGIAYAGDKKKGIILFIVGLTFGIMGRAVHILSIVAIVVWAYALYETYNQVKRANGESNPNLIEDIKGFPTSKKIGAIIVIAIIFLIVVGGVICALMPAQDTTSNGYSNNDYNYNSDSSFDDSSSSSSSSGDGASYSSSKSSDGYDTHTHYESEYGSSDTYGKVHDDGSVDSYQKGSTDYGDYEINSHMDSDGNVHGTVDVGGKTYYVDS